MNQWDSVLFDLDATLLDSQEVYRRAFSLAFQGVLGRELNSEDMARIMALPTDDFVDFYATGKQRDRLMEAINTNLERIFPGARLYTGLEGVLTFLSQAGIRLAVVTSQSRVETQDSRAVIKIDHFIQAWVTADDVVKPKPDPEPVRAALQILGARPERSLLIGDGLFDMQAGRAAGVRVGAALWGAMNKEALIAYQPDYIFYSPIDLYALVNGNQSS